MRPQPTTPSVLPNNSVPLTPESGISPVRAASIMVNKGLVKASIRVRAASATPMVTAGELATITPYLVAAGMSIFSTPAPNLTTPLSRRQTAKTWRVIHTRRISVTSASERAAISSASFLVSTNWTSPHSSRRGIFSSTNPGP